MRRANWWHATRLPVRCGHALSQSRSPSEVTFASVAGRAVRLGIRSQSLAYYVPTETALQLAATVRAIVGYCGSNPAHYHLMLQRTAPGFTPSEESHAQALAALQVLLRRSP